jgi:hypothetical protein
VALQTTDSVTVHLINEHKSVSVMAATFTFELWSWGGLSPLAVKRSRVSIAPSQIVKVELHRHKLFLAHFCGKLRHFVLNPIRAHRVRRIGALQA